MSNQVNKTIQEVLREVAHTLESGQVGPSLKIGLTINGSELGFDVMKEAVALASAEGLFEVVLIGEKLDWTADYEHYEANNESEVEEKLEELLSNGTIAGAVTLHHTFPIGVSTVGRVVTPALGREMFIATTTGTTATVRNEAMVLNAINGIAVAKARGIKNPTVAIVNVDGANNVERALKELQANGYEITFGESARSDGGSVVNPTEESDDRSRASDLISETTTGTSTPRNMISVAPMRNRLRSTVLMRASDHVGDAASIIESTSPAASA